MSRRRLRRAGRGDSGASAVEFAIVVPVLLLILLGILEFSFVMRDYLSVTSATRVGARIAATGAGAGPCGGTADPGDCGVGVPTTVPKLAQATADAIQRAGTAMPQDIVDYIWVFEANASGLPGTATTEAEAIANGCNDVVGVTVANCVKFRWIDAQDRFRYSTGSWESKYIAACYNATDSVGVYMKATHPYFTKFFGASLGMSERAIAKFEPLPNDQCNDSGSIATGGHV